MKNKLNIKKMGINCSHLFEKESESNLTGNKSILQKIIVSNKYIDNNKSLGLNTLELKDDTFSFFKNRSISYDKYFLNSSIKTSIINITKINSIIRGFLLRKRFKEYIKKDLINFTQALYRQFMLENMNKKVCDILDSNEEKIKDILNTSWNKFYNVNPCEEIYDMIKREKIYKSGVIFIYENNDFCSDNMREILSKVKAVYKGDVNLITNSKCGSGVMTYKNGSTKIGTYYNNEFSGWNIYINEKGILFLGLFIKGYINGMGIRYTKYGEHIYKGEFKNGLRHGKGIDKRKGFIYEGQFENDKKSGEGFLTFDSGDTYEGSFLNNKFNGYGIYKWKKDGHEYRGYYKDGSFNGKGVYKWSDSEYFSGNYVNGIKEGNAEISFPDGRKLYVNFVEGKLKGLGRQVYKNGKEKEVWFEDSKIIEVDIGKEIEGKKM